MTEQKTIMQYTITVIDEKIDVPECIAKSIPLLETLINDAKAGEDSITITEIPPDFFRILIAFLKSGKTVKHFKKLLQDADFNRESIEKWLKYLLMDVLLRQLYGCDVVNGKQAIVGMSPIYKRMEDSSLREYYVFEYCDCR